MGVLSWQCKTLSDEEMVKLLHKFIRASDRQMHAFAAGLTTIELWRMWGRVGRLRLSSERKKIRAQLTAAMRKKGLTLCPGRNLVVSCPDGANVNLVHKLMRDALRRSGIHHHIAATIKISVIKAAAENGWSMLQDHTSWVKRMNDGSSLPCKCSACPQSWPLVHGHRVCRSRDLLPWSLKTPLDYDTAPICSGTVEAIYVSLRRYLPERTIEGLVPRVNGHRLSQDMPGLADRRHRVTSHNDLRVSTMREVQRSLHGLVKVPIDKSPGELLMCCPCYYEILFDRAFQVDGIYYELAETSGEDAVNGMWHTWRNQKWSTLGGWCRDGAFPTPYVLPKSKNLEKGRPIIPYTQHYLRRVYRVVGRALSYIVKHLPVQDTFNIMDIGEFADRVKVW